MPLTFDLQPGDDRLFTDESLEQIERIEQGLLTLEHGLDGGVVNEVFRAAHTLKGSAATIGHRRMAELTHAMEDLFGAFRSGTLHEVKPFADVLLSTIDVLRSLVAEVQEGEILTDAPEPLTRQLRELLSAATAAAAARSAASGGRAGARSPSAGAWRAPPRLTDRRRLRTAPPPARTSPAEPGRRGAAPASAPDEVEDGVTNIAIAPLIQQAPPRRSRRLRAALALRLPDQPHERVAGRPPPAARAGGRGDRRPRRVGAGPRRDREWPRLLAAGHPRAGPARRAHRAARPPGRDRRRRERGDGRGPADGRPGRRPGHGFERGGLRPRRNHGLRWVPTVATTARRRARPLRSAARPTSARRPAGCRPASG